MKTIIAGSRSITDYNLLLCAIKECPWKITEVVSGTAEGPDRLGERYAKYHDLPCHMYPANWKAYGKSAGPIRNMKMAENAQALIALWDGQSKGTAHMISIAKRLGLKVYIYIVN